MNGLGWALRAGLAALVLLLGVGGASAARQGDGVTVTFWTTNEDGYPDWIAAFEKANPGITVTTQFIGDYDEMAQKVQAAVAGHATPDVAQMGQRHGLPQVIDAGVLVPAEEYLSPEDVADILPGLWSRFTYKGTKWVVPFASSTPGLWYNKTMFAAAGLDPNKPPRTWDEVVEQARALTKDTNGDGQIDQWGFGTCDDVPWYVRPMIIEAGGRLYDDNGQPTINSPQAVQALRFFGDAVNVARISPPVGHQTAEADFQAGKYGMILCSTAVRASFARGIGDAFELGVAYFPQGERQAVGLGGNGLVVFKGDQQKQAAAEALVRFLTSTDLTAEMGATTGYVAIRQSAMDTPTIKNLIADDPYAKTIYDQLPYVSDAAINPADAILWSGLLDAVETVETDPSADPQAVLDDLQAEIEDYLASYQS